MKPTTLAVFLFVFLLFIIIPCEGKSKPRAKENGNFVCTITCPDDIVVGGTSGFGAIVFYEVTSSGCSTHVQTSGLESGSVFPLGTTTNCFDAVDEMGSIIDDCCFDVTVFELVIECPPAYEGSCGNASSPNFTGWPIFDGNEINPDYDCYHATFADNFLNDCGNGENIIRTWTIMNTCGGSEAQCTQTITLSDTEAPELECPDDIQVPCNQTGAEFAVEPQVFDACGSQYSLDFDDTPHPEVCSNPAASFLRLWTVIDDCGNASSCAHNISIVCKPTIQAKNITFSNVTSTSMKVSWVEGNGDHQIVILSPFSDHDFTPPADGYDPPANSEFDGFGEQIVYNGTEGMVTVTNLQPNTTYWFRVYESVYCFGDPFYLYTSGSSNTKSQKTSNGNDPSSVVPSRINSPVPCVANPGLYQSILPEFLQDANIELDPCPSHYKCKEQNDVIWYQPVPTALENKTHSCELLPKASTCFYNLTNNWEFRQRGYITDPGGCDPCGHKQACSLVSHSELSCWNKDDRFAWDINLLNNEDCGVYIYAIENGNACTVGSSKSAIVITHTNQAGINWYSWYDNVNPNTTLIPPCNEFGTSYKYVEEKTKLGTIRDLTKLNPPGVPHLHFGVYYKTGGGPYKLNDPLFSVNRPIDLLTHDINGTKFTTSNIKGVCEASKVKNASVYFQKDSIWFFGAATDEIGRFSFITIPALEIGDSIKIVSPGYETIRYALSEDENINLNMRVPMIDLHTDSVKNPGLQIINNLPVFNDPNVTLKITGENFVTYDIVQILRSEDTSEIVQLHTNIAYEDSLFTIALPSEGENLIGIQFHGIDEPLISKKITYQPDQLNTYVVNINIEDKYLHADMYIDGQHISQILSNQVSYNLLDGEHNLLFSKRGYLDSAYIVNNAQEINLHLSEFPQSNYIESDSSIINFTLYGRIQHRRNITLEDSLQQSIVSLKQYFKEYSHFSLLPSTRTFRFRNLNQPPSPNISLAIIFEELEAITPDSHYLFKIFDSTEVLKIALNSTDEVSFDSIVQKVAINALSFSNGNALVEEFAIMKCQKPIAIVADTFFIGMPNMLSLHLSLLFRDPDSIKNDMSFILPDTVPEGLSLTLNSGQLEIVSSRCEPGIVSFEIEAEHDGLRTRNTIVVDILPLPRPTITVEGDLSFCEGDSVIFNSSLSTAYLWNDGSTSQSNSGFSTGEYFVQTTDSKGCSLISDTIQVIVYPPPPTNIEIIGTEQFCVGDSSTLKALPGLQYNWSTSEITQSIIVKTSGEYSVTVTDTLGCQGVSDPVIVSAFELPVVDLGPDLIDTIGSIILDAGPGVLAYLWNTGDTGQTITVSENGKYIVTVTDENDCSSSDSIYISFLTDVIYLDKSDIIAIYPNPNTGQFVVAGDMLEAVLLKLKVISPVGQVVYNSENYWVSGKFKIPVNLEQLSPGIYYTLIELGDRRYINRILVTSN